jgi:hypothetical protein
MPPSHTSPSLRVAAILLIAWCIFLFQGCRQQQEHRPETDSVTVQQDHLTDLHVLENAYHTRQGNLPVTQQGIILKVLADDEKGSRHQRCIVELASGRRLLIAHNIDIAPRIPGLAKGATLIFHGEYEWNRKGGVIHWTHHDPEGRHKAGWIRYQGKTYQ